MNKAFAKFIEEVPEIIRNFPGLQLFNREGSSLYLAGSIGLFDQDDIEYDSYSVKIKCSSDYPESFPLVYETEGRLPHNIDWHVYKEGNFCLCTPPEEFIYCAKGLTLLNFTWDHVVPYLHNQSFREREGYFLNERSHGLSGILESLCNLFETSDKTRAIALLYYIYKNPTPLRTSKCFCGSGKKYRHCHKKAFMSLKSIGQERLLHILTIIRRLT